MKKLSLIILLLLNVIFAFGQTEKVRWNESEIADMSPLIFKKINDTTYKTGTITIINKELHYFILTAQHVAKDMDKSSKLIFHLKNDKPLIVDLIKLLPKNKVNWINHDSADISIIELKLPRNIELRSQIIFNSFPINQINDSKALPSRSSTISFFGYPVLDVKLEYFSALNFSANICSGLITQKRIDDDKISCNFFYLNIPSIQGCSGSGVYFSVENGGIMIGGKKTILIGIMHGTKGDNTGGKLAVITPSYYVFDLINKL